MTAKAKASLASPTATLYPGGRHGDLGLTGLEIAAGQPFGTLPAAPLRDPGVGPLEALEDAVRRALVRPPVVVSFSGGRDSSVILAVATRVARRDGLDPPVAATLRFPGVGSSDEDEWQELVIRHLRVEDWEVIEPGDDLDVIGPIAGPAVARHGPLSPPNAHAIVPFAELARGGTVLTGLDGDTIFRGWRWTPVGAIALGTARPTLSNARRAGLFLAPRAVKRQVALRWDRHALQWLARDAERVVAGIRARALAAQPRRFDAYVDWAHRRRYLEVMLRQLELLAADAGATVAHPLTDERFLGAYAARGGWRGYGGQTAAMRALFGELLPDAILSRPSKARFSEVYVTGHARAFAASWDGTGLSADLVDADALRSEWSARDINFRSGMLMQWLWLRANEATT
jgi:hypothetical protein